MPRYPSTGSISYQFGPGKWTPGVKAVIVTNIAIFVLVAIVPRVSIFLGLTPAAVLENGWVWQLGTYMFLHREVFHILFNMLAVWMFGVELERMWGTAGFLRYYLVTGVGAGLTTLLVSLLPFGFAQPVYYALTLGASGSVYGLLLAYAMYYPDRPMLFFPIPIPIAVKYFVLILGGIALLSSISAGTSGVAHAAHLGGLLFGYIYLTMGRGGPLAELKYRWLKFRMSRMRRKFDVYSGGRGGPSRWDGLH